MARIRSIKPEFWSSPDAADVSRDARLMFIGLWNHADDAGRLEVIPRTLVGDIFPWDDDVTEDTVVAWIDELAEAGLVELYRVGRRTYLRITGWHHQRIDNPSKPRCPEPDEGEPLATLSDDHRETLARPSRDPSDISRESDARSVGPSDRRSVGNTLAADAPSTNGKSPDHHSLFTALAEACGLDTSELTKNEAGRIGVAAKQLVEVGASAGDVEAKAKAYRKKWPDIDLTPTGLASNWSQVTVSARTSPSACERCNQLRGHRFDCPHNPDNEDAA